MIKIYVTRQITRVLHLITTPSSSFIKRPSFVQIRKCWIFLGLPYYPISLCRPQQHTVFCYALALHRPLRGISSTTRRMPWMVANRMLETEVSEIPERCVLGGLVNWQHWIHQSHTCISVSPSIETISFPSHHTKAKLRLGTKGRWKTGRVWRTSLVKEG